MNTNVSEIDAGGEVQLSQVTAEQLRQGEYGCVLFENRGREKEWGQYKNNF